MINRILLLQLLILPTVAGAYDMTRRDRMAILYSNQVVFDKRGEPLVSVRITEGQDTVQFSSSGRLVLMPGGDEGSQVFSPAKTEWTVRLEQGKPGQSEWWVAAERVSASDVSVVAARRQAWTNKGFKVRIFEAGALLGLSGKTLDTRSITIGIEPQSTQKAAETLAAKLADQLTLKNAVISEPKGRPSGWLYARERKTGIEIKSRDLLWITPSNNGTTRFKELEWGHGTPKRGRVDRSYAGDIYIAVGRDGKLAVVNVLSAERLLEGVVPSELYTSAPLEALKAQAVAARGQLLAKVGTRHRSDPYLLCAETHCQVYSGTAKKHPRTSRAVKQTRGKLLFYKTGLVDTTYSSSCGGHSEAFHQMWGGTPKPYSMGLVDNDAASQKPLLEGELEKFLKSPPPSFCGQAKRGSRVFRWTVKRGGDAVTKAVNSRAQIGDIHRIEVLKRGHSGRALAVKYHGQNGTHIVRGSYNNRKLLGGLRSGMWLVKKVGGLESKAPLQWVFTGGGFGHGVGMCQHGAMGMATSGHDVSDILKHYYPGSELRKAW
ncbi:MAG: SpoIID/LytB domain-containing protein [Myxococcota bacterium]|nr:SpoIID/LytB domain-containing protein [Myxococcota bacterium]